MPILTFPDGAKRDFPEGATGADVAASISKSLAKHAVAMKLDGELRDLVAAAAQARLAAPVCTLADPTAGELVQRLQELCSSAAASA